MPPPNVVTGALPLPPFGKPTKQTCAPSGSNVAVQYGPPPTPPAGSTVLVQLQLFTLHPGVHAVSNTDGNGLPAMLSSSGACRGSLPHDPAPPRVVGIRQSLCPARLLAFSWANQSQIVVSALNPKG